MDDPLALLAADRARATAAADPFASLCVLATAAGGRASARTLVLRDIDGTLAIFTNASSPKWQELHAGVEPELLVYLPSCRVQYRLRGRLLAIDTATMHAHWQRRPEWGRRLDGIYETRAQSSALDSDAFIDALRAAPPALPDTMPAGVRGLRLDAHEVERLLLDDARPPHDRRRWQRTAGAWQAVRLLP